MNYLQYIFLSHLPYIEEESRYIAGEEQVCLIIPTKTNQIKKGKQGNWLMMTRLAELPPNERMQTHDLQLSYITEKELQKSYDNGYHSRTAHLGRVYAHDRTPAKKIDRSNKALTNITCDGLIVLSDIPKSRIFRNAENDKRYVNKLIFRPYDNRDIIYTGSICIDDIPKENIIVDTDTGKKYIKCRFKKIDKLDTYMNTHQLVIVAENGMEVEIGRFKEWVSDKKQQDNSPVQEPSDIGQHNTGVNQRITPDNIDGIRF